jgi:hypothetical protein
VTPEIPVRKAMNPIIQQRLAREEAERIAAEREAEMLANQLNRTPPVKPVEQSNPTVNSQPAPFRRIPMNTARRKLEVRPIPGFQLYWHRQTDIEAALDAGYVFVDKAEVSVNSHSIGSASGLGGNTDLGSNVSIVGSKGTGERLILMKLKQEWADEDKRMIFQEHAQRMRAIFEGDMIMMPGGEGRPDVVVGPDGQLHGSGTTYVKKQPYVALFNRGPRVAPQVAGAKVRTY